jgi:protoporphyrinogen oxidase
VSDAVPGDGTAAGELGRMVGAAFRDRVMRPYLEKVDGWPLEVISADRAAKLRDEQRAPDGFWFPAGGIGALMDAMEHAIRAEGADVRLGTPMTALVHEGGRVVGVQVGGCDPGMIEAPAVISAVTPGLAVKAANPAAPPGLLPPITMRAVALVYLMADRERITEEALRESKHRAEENVGIDAIWQKEGIELRDRIRRGETTKEKEALPESQPND